MNQKYNKVPEIITGKDLDYLSDMFQWNYEALKKTYDSMNVVEDEEIIQIFEKATTIFEENINIVLDILTTGGANNE